MQPKIRPLPAGCELLAEFMRWKCLRKSVAARALGVSHATLSRWLIGTRRPDREHRQRIERECGLRPDGTVFVPENSWLSAAEIDGLAWADRVGKTTAEEAASASSETATL